MIVYIISRNVVVTLSNKKTIMYSSLKKSTIIIIINSYIFGDGNMHIQDN